MLHKDEPNWSCLSGFDCCVFALRSVFEFRCQFLNRGHPVRHSLRRGPSWDRHRKSIQHHSRLSSSKWSLSTQVNDTQLKSFDVVWLQWWRERCWHISKDMFISCRRWDTESQRQKSYKKFKSCLSGGFLQWQSHLFSVQFKESNFSNSQQSLICSTDQPL